MATIRGELAAVGGPPPGLSRPRPGTIRLTDTATHVQRQVRTDNDGRYSVRIPPGTYQIEGRSPGFNGGTYQCQALKAVTVTAGGTISADVYCQMM